MNIPENNYINKMLAILAIIILTLSDFLFVGNSLISYALDIVNTNNENVEFMAYFMSETGDRIDKKEQNIDKETKLFIEVAVKQDGYFNGKLVLNDSNFKFKLGQENEYINQVTEDTLMLNQINAGSTLNLEVLIEPKVSERINANILDTETKVLLQGNYINSKNVAGNANTEIKGIDTVQISWKSSEEIEQEFDSKIITNYVYQENGEEKRIVQVLINSNIKDNAYPIKQNVVVMNVPENVQDVKVHTRSTEGTKSDIIFNESNYKYDNINRILKIKLDNKDTDNIYWNKNAKDTFVVTCTFSKEEELQNKDIIVGNLINTYDDKNLTAKRNITIEGEIDGITSSTIQNEENIYKGKIYTGEEREYNVNTTINIDYLNVLNKIEITQKQSTFVKGEEELDANIVYKSTKISKDEFLKIFGEDGFITIKDEKQAVIANINKNTQTDENGKIVVNYINETKALNIVTSKPIAIGMLNIENTKAIKSSGYSREEIGSFTAIKEKVAINQNEETNLITLKETKSQAEIKVNPTVIHASQESQQMEIEATLLANDETKDLYKNPKVTFVFPSELSVESAKFGALYKNGLEVKSNTAAKNENGQDCIEINFEGEQTQYDYIGGTIIRIKAQVKADSTVPTKTSTIKMIYTNENTPGEFWVDANYTHENEPKQQLLASTLEANRNINEPNDSTVAETTDEKINITTSTIVGSNKLNDGDEVFEGETLRYKVTVTNNTGKDYTNVAINATQKNGYIWDWCDEEVYNFVYSPEKMVKQFYKESNENSKNLGTIETLKNGETYTYEYDATSYLLNNQSIEGDLTFGTITVKSENNELNESQNTISNKIKTAELKVQLTDRKPQDVEMNDGIFIEGLLTIENLTNTQMDNMKIKLLFSKNIKISENDYGFLLTDHDSRDRVSIDGVTENDNGIKVVTISLTTINPNETVLMAIQPTVEELEKDSENTQILAGVETASKNIYYSNRMERNTKKVTYHYDLDLTQKITYKDGKTIDYDNDKLENNSEIVITGEILNKNEKTQEIRATYKIDSALDIQKVVLVAGGEQKDITNEVTSNRIYINKRELTENESLKIIVNAKVNTGKSYDGTATNILEVTNYTGFNDDKRSELKFNLNKPVYKEDENEEQEDEEEIIGSDIETNSEPLVIEGSKHKTDIDLEENEEKPNEEENKNDSQSGNQNENQNKDNTSNNNESTQASLKQYTLTGTAWIDKNKNGKRENNEEKLNNMSVGIINTQNGNEIGATKTDAEGKYSFNVAEGNYIVVFYYNDTMYALTTYQADGVEEAVNSDAIQKTMLINNKQTTAGATDSIIVNANKENIDIGLIYKSNFDLKIEKYVSKIIVNNNAGTKTYEQPENTKLAKAEIKAKYLSGSLVVIEYKIKVTNVGDIEGYAKSIVDYLPSSLSFNSSLNSDWYKSGEYLYNTSLANTKINPGETKELTLTVTKQMTETNTGLINNKAEIQSSSNALGIEDSSKDTGSADVIISVGTGALVQYLLLTGSIFLILILVAYLINKKGIQEK